jgi:DNA-binding NarL/FixJ family response regulator
MLGIPGSALWNPARATWQHAPMAMTVLIVDDHPIFRSFARDLLESEGFHVVGEAQDGSSALEGAVALHPDLVLLDVQLPDLTGFEVVARLREDGVATPVVLTSSRDASSYGDQIETSGALGFVPKAELSGDAIRALVAGAG